jgi:cyclic pyranopterin phosphate synthase
MKSREFRFILTQSCNYSCTFCHNEGFSDSKEKLLSPEDYVFIFSSGKTLFGWDALTVSGGEPLILPNIAEILRSLNANGAKTNLITNGSLIDSIDIIDYVNRITVSIHSLDPIKYDSITRGSIGLPKIMDNLISAHKHHPDREIRINCTLSYGINTDGKSISELCEFAKSIHASIKFIEMCSDTDTVYPIKNIKPVISSLGYHPIESDKLQEYYVNSHGHIIILSKLVCALVKEFGDPDSFCVTTNSIFVASNGVIKPCMYNNFELNILKEIKDRNVNGLKQKIHTAIGLMPSLCAYQQ